MAKDKDAIYQDFLADLKSTVGDDKWAAIEEGLVKNDAASTKLRESVLARSEFSRQMDTLRSERQQFEANVAEANKRIDGWKDWYGTVTAESAKTTTQLKAYEDLYGPLDRSTSTVKPTTGMSKEDLQKAMNEELQRRDMANLRFVTDLQKVTSDFGRRFPGEDLDLQGVYKVAGERNLPLPEAYKSFISERVETKNKEDFDKAILQAKEEGAKEYASKHKLPFVEQTPTIVHTLDVTEHPTTAADRIKAAVAGFNDLVSNRR